MDEQDELQRQRDQRIRRALRNMVATEEARESLEALIKVYWVTYGRAVDRGATPEEAHEQAQRAVKTLLDASRGA